MAIDQVAGGAGYTPQVDAAKLNTDNTAKLKAEEKPVESQERPVQDKVEIRQNVNTGQVNEADRVKENNAAQQIKDTVKAQMESNPYQAMYAQGNNMTASRVANLL